ncbi:hypothetical protein K493DRAFT_342172 [Basidiobolus meristosporus CBS 931.73]|uniref:V-type proton ATPase subunit S1/VOA1 transmembrane domain-containing protein n=1 Tax=Basidiobolus meristosporus CBS 931.73 TaxID=1314790 RepID=A0A1Y1XA47_9FUNG|nr:hypothetical protein K493DRAFT_342172 [Basidiobolus meristosporus CBS 931.73]|eukprot:ORX82622.1 hypothetical protein K493DRAFT_342172 [Basidiobolus meristosporus CBS 931.73]
MRSSSLFKVFAVVATTVVSTAYAECPAKVALVLNKQQTAEYLDSPSFSLHKRMVADDTPHAENVESIKSNCGAKHLDLADVANLKDDSSYVISGIQGAVDKALEHIQAVAQDYVVVLDRKAHLQKRQAPPAPTSTPVAAPTASPSGPSVSAPSGSSANVPGGSSASAPSPSQVAPGPTTNPGKNVSRAEELRSKFWTVGLLTGLLTTFIMVLILLVGICWLASIEGPTRFETVKQKRS